MSESRNQTAFEAIILPHLDAGYSLARWLVRRPEEAEDLVQEALLRAMKYFFGYRGGDPKSWFLVIVRNTCYSWIQRNQKREMVPLPDDEGPENADGSTDPEAAVLSDASRQLVRKAVGDLPVEFREVIVLREIEGLSYKEISDVVALPIGTVMSRLSRARARLQESLKELRSSS